MDKQQIKARFFGQYIGCDVDIFLNGKVVHQATNFGAIWPGNRNSVLVSIGEIPKYSDEEFDIKLILRPQSSLTGNEMAHLYAIAMSHPASKKQLVGAIKFDYLRSINVCAPFMGLDPVKEGWAVLAE